MKSFWIILSFVFLIQPILPVVEYVVNYDYIANVLCINKGKEASTCNGKCHLVKEIVKNSINETSKDKPVHTVKKIQLETLFFQETENQILHTSIHFFTKHFYSYTSSYNKLVVTDVFKPPIFLLK